MDKFSIIFRLIKKQVEIKNAIVSQKKWLKDLTNQAAQLITKNRVGIWGNKYIHEYIYKLKINIINDYKINCK